MQRSPSYQGCIPLAKSTVGDITPSLSPPLGHGMPATYARDRTVTGATHRISRVAGLFTRFQQNSHPRLAWWRGCCYPTDLDGPLLPWRRRYVTRLSNNAKVSFPVAGNRGHMVTRAAMACSTCPFVIVSAPGVHSRLLSCPS